MTPEHIRIAAIPCAVIFAVYWLLIWWLRPKLEPSPSVIPAQTTSGDGSPIIGSIHTANFNSVTPEPALRSAVASQTVELLRDIETKYCRKSYVGIMQMLDFFEMFQNNIIIVVGSNCGTTYVEKEAYDKAQDSFEGGGTILRTDMKNFSDGPMRELTLPPGEVCYVNFPKQAGETMDELSKLVLSPFLPAEVKESLESLRKAISDIFTDMITFLNDRLRTQRVRLIAAVNDTSVYGGLSNEFMSKAAALDEPISHLRETIRRSLTNG